MQTAPSGSDSDDFSPVRSGVVHGGQDPSLVVSIHDLSTVTRGEVARMLADLREVGVERTSLLVIPDHHRKGRIDSDPGFVASLKDWSEHGHEVVLHGFYHLRPVCPGEGVATRLVTRSYTAGEGEFYDLGYTEAVALLRSGKKALEAGGIAPKGFIAPAWLLGSEAERAVRDEGFEYTTRIGRITDFRSGEVFGSRSMVYSVRSGWRRGVSLIWNGALFRLLRYAPLLRIGLHPPDWRHAAIRRHALECIAAAVKKRRVTTYWDWLDDRRPSVHEQGRC